MRTIIRFGPDGTLDSTFNAKLGTEESVQLFTPTSNGKIAYFSYYPSPHLAQLLPDGTADGSFAPTPIKGSLWDLLALANGKVLVSTTYGAVQLINSDGTVDATFVPPTLDQAALTLGTNWDGGILIGGVFSTVNGISAPMLALLRSNGSLDSSLDGNLSQLNGFIQGFYCQSDGMIVIRGNFTHAGTSYWKNLARLNRDGTPDAGFEVDPRSYDTITKVNNSDRPRALLLATVSNGKQQLIRVDNGDLTAGAPVLGGDSTNPIGKFGQAIDLQVLARSLPAATYSWLFDGVPLPDQTNGFISLAQPTYTNMGEYALVASNSIGAATSGPVHLVVNALPVSAGSVDPSFDPGTGFTGSAPRDFNPEVVALALQGNMIIAGGSFSAYNGTPAHCVARLYPSGKPDPTFDIGSGPDIGLSTLAVDSENRVLIGGILWTAFSGRKPGHLLRVEKDGAFDATFSPPLIGAFRDVYSIHVLPDGASVVCGTCLDLSCSCLTSACPAVMARIKSGGQSDPSFIQGDLQLTPHFWATSFGFQHDGRIIVAGGSGGGGQGWVARLESDGTIDLTFHGPAGFSAPVSAVQVLRDDRILLGFDFATTILPDTRYVTSVALDPGGQLLTNVAQMSSFRLAELPDGSVVGGGSILWRLLFDGQLDTNFVCRADGTVSAIIAQPDGSLLIGGTFSKVNGTPRAGIARIYGSEQVPQPYLIGPTIISDRLEFRLPTVAIGKYHLESTAAIGAESWTTVTNLVGDGNWQTVVDVNPRASERFFRARAE